MSCFRQKQPESNPRIEGISVCTATTYKAKVIVVQAKPRRTGNSCEDQKGQVVSGYDHTAPAGSTSRAISRVRSPIPHPVPAPAPAPQPVPAPVPQPVAQPGAVPGVPSLFQSHVSRMSKLTSQLSDGKDCATLTPRKTPIAARRSFIMPWRSATPGPL